MQVQANNQNNPNEPQQQTNNNRKRLIYLICLLLFFSFSTRVSKSNTKSQQNVMNKIKYNQSISLQQMLQLYLLGQTYEGVWRVQTQQKSSNSKYLQSLEGKYLINVYRQYQTINYSFYIQIFDGYYIDKGILNFGLSLLKDMFEGSRDNNTFIYQYSKNVSLNTTYDKRQMLLYPETGIFEFQDIVISFSYDNNQLSNQISFTFVDEGNSTRTLRLEQLGRENTTLNLIIFSVVLLFVSVLPFLALMSIIKSIYELRDNPRGYSLLTIGFTCMWDCTLCIVAFMYAFSDQQSLMLFIIQAFLFCLLFTNLQPRFMIFIFQHLHNNNNIRQIICKFNLFHYSTLLLIYPILLYTNMNWTLYIGLSCILFPQIYTNGVNGFRPDLTSNYYMKYILSRYLLILYLKCYPYNIFYLEPDYALIFICTMLISLQFLLLYVQKRFGAKKILPGFLLEPVFNYKFEDETNNQDPAPQAQECAICLMPYDNLPPQNPNELQFQPSFKLMKTPCNHVYHSRCLIIWMKVKMQCPQCRHALPPFQ